jgi:hypothetical protein
MGRGSPRNVAHLIKWEGLDVLLNDTKSFFEKYLVLTEEELDLMSVWTAHTFAIEAFDYTPYLAVTSATKGSGKTVILKCLCAVVYNPILAAQATKASILRTVNTGTPTFLFDEYDSIDPELRRTYRGMLNSGFERGLASLQCDTADKGHEVLDMDPFCPKAIAAIGDIESTISDRSVHIRAIKKLRTDIRAKFQVARNGEPHPEGGPLADRFKEWAVGATEALRTASVEVPSVLHNRAEDIWTPLLLIAQMAGYEWYVRIVNAAEALVGARDDSESLPERLLGDLRRIREPMEARTGSQEVVGRLVQLEDAPWGSYSKEWGTQLMPSKLASMLRPFGIQPKPLRIGAKITNGYEWAAFEDLWLRYLPEEVNSPNIINTIEASGEAA